MRDQTECWYPSSLLLMGPKGLCTIHKIHENCAEIFSAIVRTQIIMNNFPKAHAMRIAKDRLGLLGQLFEPRLFLHSCCKSLSNEF